MTVISKHLQTVFCQNHQRWAAKNCKKSANSTLTGSILLAKFVTLYKNQSAQGTLA